MGEAVNKHRVAVGVIVAMQVFLCIGMAGCSSPQEKAERYYQKGQEWLQRGEPVKAQLDFRNALQINPNMVPALLGLASIAEQEADWSKTYALLARVVEVDPTQRASQIKMGQLLLGSGDADKAMAASDALLAAHPEDLDGMALKAAAYLKQGNRAAAIRLAQQVLVSAPQHTDALVVLASERMDAKDPVAALGFIDRALMSDAHSVPLLLIKARALEQQSKWADAQAVYQQLVTEHPERRGYRDLLVAFYVAHSQWEAAEALLTRVADAKPQDAQARLDVVRLITLARGPEAGMTELKRLVASNPGQPEWRIALAQAMASAGQGAEAERMYRGLIDEGGEGDVRSRARTELAELLLTHHDRAKAEVLVRQALEKDARNERALLLRAAMAIEDQQLDAAIADLRTILRDAPGSAQALLLLGQAHELQGARDLALEHYTRAFQAGKQSHPETGMGYAEYQLKLGKGRAAIDTLHELLGLNPAYLPGWRLLAQAYVAQGDYVKALGVADTVAQLPNGAAPSQLIRGSTWVAQKKFEAGIAALRKAHELAPKDARTVPILVGAYELAGKPDQAISFLQTVVDSDTGNIEMRLLRAGVLERMGRLEAAQKAYESVLEIEPRSRSSYVALARIYTEAQHPDVARTVLAKGLQAMPGDAQLRLIHASWLETQGEYESAITAYTELNKDRPSWDVVANNLAGLLLDHRQGESNWTQAYQLVQRFKSSPVPQYKDTYGWACYRLGKYADAVVALRSASEQLPELGVAQYHYGMTLAAMNSTALAKEVLQKALALSAKQPFPEAKLVKEVLQTL